MALLFITKEAITMSKARFQLFDGEYTVFETKDGVTVEGYFRLHGNQIHLKKERGSREPVFATYDVSDVKWANFYHSKEHRERATY